MRKVKRDTSRRLIEDLAFLKDYLTTYFIEYKRKSKYVEAFRSMGLIEYQIFEDVLLRGRQVNLYAPYPIPLSRRVDWMRMLDILITRLGFRGFKIVVTQKCFECALLQATIVAMESAKEQATSRLRVDAVLYTTDPLLAEAVEEWLRRRGDVAVSVERRDVNMYKGLIKYVVSGLRVGRPSRSSSFPALSRFAKALVILAFFSMFPAFGYKTFNRVGLSMASGQKDLLDTDEGTVRLGSGADAVVKFMRLVDDEKLKLADPQVLSTDVDKEEPHKPLLLKYDVEGENLHYEVQTPGWIKMEKLLVSLVDDKYAIVSINTVDKDIMVAMLPVGSVAFIPGWAGPVLVPAWRRAPTKHEREKWAKVFRETLYEYLTEFPLMEYVIKRYRKYAQMQLEDYKRGRWPPPGVEAVEGGKKKKKGGKSRA